MMQADQAMPGSMFHHPSAMMLLTQLQQLEHRLVAKFEEKLAESMEMMRAATTSLPPPPALERQQAMGPDDDDAMTEVLTQELPAYDDDHDEEEKTSPNQNGEEEYKRCDVEPPRPKRQRFQTSHFMFNAE